VGITERIDAITHLPVERRNTIVPVPRSVKIELTARCNFACSFCARGDKLRQQGDMSVVLYKRLIREMREAGVEELGLFYLGESFMCPWLPEAIADAKAVGYPYVFLTTNGSLVTRGKAEAVFSAGLDSLKFSFNFADADQFARVTNVKAGLYEKVRANVHGARLARDAVEAETGHRCGLYASYIEYDGEQGARMAETAEWLRGIVDEVYALPLYNQAGFCKRKIAEEHVEWTATAGNMGRVGGLVPPIPCWSVAAEGHVCYDGRLSACCFDHDGRFTMADLNNTGFLEGWNSQKFQDLRAAHLAKDLKGSVCEKCVAWS